MKQAIGPRATSVALALFLAIPTSWVAAQLADPLPPVAMYAPSPCPECADWVKQLRQSGFVVTLEEKPPVNMSRMKRWLNVPSQLESTHTARVAGYFIEGSVPVEDILRLLKEKPLARGLGVSAVPGNAPGQEKFNTLLVAPDGLTRVYAAH